MSYSRFGSSWFSRAYKFSQGASRFSQRSMKKTGNMKWLSATVPFSGLLLVDQSALTTTIDTPAHHSPLSLRSFATPTTTTNQNLLQNPKASTEMIETTVNIHQHLRETFEMDTTSDHTESNFESVIDSNTLGNIIESITSNLIAGTNAMELPGSPDTMDVSDSSTIAGQEKKSEKMKFESGVYVIAHPTKVAKGGEDAYFITDKIIGVADGVGGWNEIGIDPSLYSRKLMEGGQIAAEEWLSTSEKQDNLRPVELLRKAFDYVTSQNVIGSTTACIIGLEGSLLKAANLGDSGFLIVRDNKVVFRTKEQQFSFNFPYQIGTNSDCMPETHADSLTFEVQEGDVVVAGTDGLFDNMFDQEILDCLIQNSSQSPQYIAEQIAENASKLAQEWLRISPFAKAAHSNGLAFVFGGKVDDITVVVSRVQSAQQ